MTRRRQERSRRTPEPSSRHLAAAPSSSTSQTGKPHRLPTAEAHCTPLNMLMADLRRRAKTNQANQTRTRRYQGEDQDIQQVIEGDDYLEKGARHIEQGRERQWTTSNKAYQLKTTGWNLAPTRGPWFSSPRCSRATASRVHQVISGHLPTEEYLQGRGHSIEDARGRMCGLQQETRDHLCECTHLRTIRQELLLPEALHAEDIGVLLREGRQYARFDEY